MIKVVTIYLNRAIIIANFVVITKISCSKKRSPKKRGVNKSETIGQKVERKDRDIKQFT